jgi:hypothetical protein
MPRGVSLPEDVLNQEVSHAHNEAMWVLKEKKKARSAAHWVVKERG